MCDDPIYQLIAETCRHPQGSIERKLGLDRIVRRIIQSGKLWRENTPYYEDALQQTWLYFCRNLCETTTAKCPYDCTRSHVTTWLNSYLKMRLREFYLQAIEDKKNKVFDPFPEPIPPKNYPSIVDEVREWAETDADGDLRGTHIQGHPEANCQALILRRLPPSTKWADISAEFDISVSALSSFYQRQCFPRLRNFAKLDR
jgi:hypothetical protein